MSRTALTLALLLAATAAAQAAEPIRIGITTVLSGPLADRGQSAQYGAQLAIDRINEAGGVLGRPLEAYYADNACKPEIGVPATKRLIEQEHVPVIIGALCTPVTHAIMPVIQAAKVPLLIATSAGEDFVDASGEGGNVYAFKTIPSETDIAGGLVKYLLAKGVKSIAVVTDPGGFTETGAKAIGTAAQAAGLKVTQSVTLAPGTNDFPAIVGTLKAGAPDAVVAVLGPSTTAFFKSLAAADWNVPVSGRYNLAAAAEALPHDSPLLAGLTSAAVFSPADDTPGVQAFVAGYLAHYGIMPTQRPFFVYEAVNLVADAIRRAGSDQPEAIDQALKTTAMPSLLGGTYAVDAHNHPHTPILMVGMKADHQTVVARE